MNVFTEVYEKSIDLLRSPALDESWKAFEADLKNLLKADGPDVTRVKVLDDIRDHLKKASKGKGSSDVLIADEIIKACKADTNGFQDRAALVKMMQHFYMVAKKGNQNVWVVDSPKKLVSWGYDQFSGKSKVDLQTELKANTEVFGIGNRKMMSDALQLARKWSADVQIKLGTNDADLKAKVKRWFHSDAATDQEVAASVALLLDGFKKVHAVCNSSQVIFSDRPHLRASGKYDSTYASVNGGDAMPVIYIFQVFLETGKRTLFGNIPKLWLCALTVVHELTHKLVNTEDVRYDDDGLKPGLAFPSADALKNADSWAYFAADVVGVLSEATLNKVLV